MCAETHPVGCPPPSPPWRFWSVNKEGVFLTCAPACAVPKAPPGMAQVGVGPGHRACHTQSIPPPLTVVRELLSSCQYAPRPRSHTSEDPDPLSQARGAEPPLPGPSAGSVCASQQGGRSGGVGSHWLCSRATCQRCGPVTGLGRGVGGSPSPEHQVPHYISTAARPASLSAAFRVILHTEA